MRPNTDSTLGRVEVGVDPTDPRWQLVERVVASSAFQKSARLRDLLCYLAERSIHDHRSELTEQRIGQAVFGKPADYSPTADSSVRVHIRQLRLKLHEYFDSEGRHEPLIVEIPKGGYAPVFRSAEATVEPHALAPIDELRPRLSVRTALPWTIALVMTILCVVLWTKRAPSPKPAPWPLSAVLAESSRTQIVVADANYSMLRIMSQEPASLEEYLKPDFRERFSFSHLSDRESRILRYVSKSLLTSYADVAVVTTILKLAEQDHDRISVRSAKDLRLRDLEEGNFIFIGSPTSNPWVSLFEGRLNFQDVQDIIGSGPKYFRNKHPETGEQGAYYGLTGTGDSGEDYATISVFPTETKRGNIMVIQGLRQEGTEAAGLFLGSETNRRQLEKILGRGDPSKEPLYFELLLRAKAVAGSPGATSIVATRVLQR